MRRVEPGARPERRIRRRTKSIPLRAIGAACCDSGDSEKTLRIRSGCAEPDGEPGGGAGVDAEPDSANAMLDPATFPGAGATAGQRDGGPAGDGDAGSDAAGGAPVREISEDGAGPGAEHAGRAVRIEFSGQETGLDKSLLEAIKDPLTHALRNAIDHGIEEPRTTSDEGGQADLEGLVRMRARHQSGSLW